MDGYQFTAAILQSVVSLGWPLAFVGAVFLFREQLRGLLPLLRVEHKDWKASFGRAEHEVASLPPMTSETQPTPEEKERFEQLAILSPRAAISELRIELEQAVQKLLERYGGSPDKPQTLLTATRILRSKKLIDNHTSALLDDLRSIANNAAHNTNMELTKEDAMRFKRLADQAIGQLLHAEVNYIIGD
jgi:hypothetical protein